MSAGTHYGQVCLKTKVDQGFGDPTMASYCTGFVDFNRAKYSRSMLGCGMELGQVTGVGSWSSSFVQYNRPCRTLATAKPRAKVLAQRHVVQPEPPFLLHRQQ